MRAPPLPTAWTVRADAPGAQAGLSYPAADRFVEAFTADDYAQALAQRREGPAALALPLALYVHLPFCKSLCYYCACDKVVTRQRERAQSYLRYLEREVGLLLASLGPGGSVTQLHLGGGSPTFLTDDELGQLMAMLRRGFALGAAECSIEIDAREVDATRLQALADLGFNRLGFGVQDLDPAVQKAVHRVQPAAQVAALIERARALGFGALHVDLMAGLPRQTRDSFAHTLEQVARWRPDRIALHAYSHQPERFKAQRQVASADVPDPDTRAALLMQARTCLERSGYVHLGLDEFALAADRLVVARRQGRLHRGCHGYTTQPDCDRIGLGVSAIGRIGATSSQNARTLAEYCDCLDQGRLPVVRGLVLTRDDLARRAVITALSCQGQLVYESIELAWLLDFRTHFAAELAQLAVLQRQGLVTLDASGIQVTPKGRFEVRGIAAVFDRYLQADRQRAECSRIL